MTDLQPQLAISLFLVGVVVGIGLDRVLIVLVDTYNRALRRSDTRPSARRHGGR